jgi:hypothetical protein
MKLLLDENLPRKLKSLFPPKYSISTVIEILTPFIERLCLLLTSNQLEEQIYIVK